MRIDIPPGGDSNNINIYICLLCLAPPRLSTTQRQVTSVLLPEQKTSGLPYVTPFLAAVSRCRLHSGLDYDFNSARQSEANEILDQLGQIGPHMFSPWSQLQVYRMSKSVEWQAL